MKLLYEPVEKDEPQVSTFMLLEIMDGEGGLSRKENGELRLKELNHAADAADAEEERQKELEKRRLARMQEQADEMLRKSVSHSREILDEARRQSQKIREEAFDEGRKAGYEIGKEEGRRQAYEEHEAAFRKELDSLKKEITSYVAQMEHAKEKVIEEHLDDLKDISLAVAEKIMKISLKSSSEIIKRMILAATDKLKKTAWVKVYIGKEEAGMDLRGDRELLMELSKISDNVKIVMMEEAEEGTCIIEMPNEIIDASAATQIENVKDILNNARL